MKKILSLTGILCAFLAGAIIWDLAVERDFLDRLMDKLDARKAPPKPVLQARPIQRFPRDVPPAFWFEEELKGGPVDPNPLAQTVWPGWRGNARRTGCSFLPGPDINHIRWLVPTEGVIESSPAVGFDGTLYIGSHDKYLHAYSPAGKLRWKFETLGLIRSSPCIAADGTIYVGSFDGSLYAIHPDGTLKWSYYSGGRILSSPAVDKAGNVYIASQNGELHSVDPEGFPNWRVKLNGDVSVTSTVIADDGMLYQAVYTGYLYAIHPSGEVKWELKVTDGGIRGTPAIGEDGTIYVGDRSGYLLALNPEGERLWRFTTKGDLRASPCIAPDGSLILGSYDNHIYKVSSSGELIWKKDLDGPIESSPVVDSRGVIYACAQASAVFALSPEGEEMWRIKWGVINTAPVIGPDKSLYLSTDYAAMLIGAPFPAVYIKEESYDSNKLDLTFKNADSREVKATLKYWGTTPDGTNLSLGQEDVTLAAQSEQSGSIDLSSVANKPLTTIVATMLDAVSGDLVSEDIIYLQKLNQK